MTVPNTNPKHPNGKLPNGFDGNGDFVENLLERCAENPRYAFTPEVVDRLASLKQSDRLAFETLRARLKETGCRITALDDVIDDATDKSERNPNQTDILIGLANDIELFHASDGVAYADIQVSGHRETWNVRSEGFGHWLSRRFFKETRRALTPDTLHSSLANFEAKARFEGQEQSVFLRAGGIDGKIYIDLCNKNWEAVEIDCTGWRIINNPPVQFKRVAGMKELPKPVAGGSIGKIRDFLNVESDGDFVLAVSWILAALRPHGPFPIMVLNGEMGSSKSTFSNILKSLVDPSASSIRTLPRKDTDLFISASNAYVLAFDNISGLTNSISDTLCRLSTGGSHVARELFTNQKELTFSATRPMILNGIEEFVNRSDLADRSLFLTLESIPEDKRRAETEFWKSFEAERPYILGALFDGMVEGLRNINSTRLPKLPRMADFALWASACEGAFWDKGAFWKAYNDNREDVIEHVIEADPLADTIRSFITRQTQREWSGTASDLLVALTANGRNKPRGYPNSPHSLSGHLRRVATFLRKMGIEIEFAREKRTGRRIIRIHATDNFLDSSGGETAASEASNPAQNGGFSISLVTPDARKSSLSNSEKSPPPVLSCRFEGTVSIQPETLYDGEGMVSLQGTTHTRGIRWDWWEKMKRVFIRIGVK